MPSSALPIHTFTSHAIMTDHDATSILPLDACARHAQVTVQGQHLLRLDPGWPSWHALTPSSWTIGASNPHLPSCSGAGYHRQHDAVRVHAASTLANCSIWQTYLGVWLADIPNIHQKFSQQGFDMQAAFP